MLSRLIAQVPLEAEDKVIAPISISDADQTVEDVLIMQCNEVPLTVSDVAEESSKDSDLQQLKQHVLTGWPKKFDSALSAYFPKRSSISIIFGCLMANERVIIPRSLRSQVLTLLHEGHKGIVRMKAYAAQYVYWPKIDSETEQLVKGYSACFLAAKAPIKATLRPWRREEEPWKRVNTDFAGPFKGRMFFIIVDFFTRWPEIFEMPTISLQATIECLQKVFDRFGYPEVLVSDNGTQLTSNIFRQFCSKYGIDHVRSPPYHPQTGMTSQFNKHQGAKEVSFAVGAPIFFRIYQGNKINWAPGSISQKIGQRVYDIRAFDGKLHRRHANQLRAQEPPFDFENLLLDRESYFYKLYIFRFKITVEPL
uniref:RNA-directed DNA polymerase n=1 Tax=Ditylenchus dipsaci TaxID=166011 RepID=A0A915CUK1_9BILA